MLIDKNIGIYLIINTINGKFYIGSSSNIKQRIYNHKYKLLNNTHVNKHLQSSVNKYGFENFKFDILANCPIENLDSLEQWYVDNLQPQYNIRKFVESNRDITLSENHKEKISNAMIGKFCKITIQYDKNMNFIKEWKSLTEIGKNGFCLNKVSLCCNNKRKSHKGYIWKFKTIEKNGL